jgi:hypothetical protein
MTFVFAVLAVSAVVVVKTAVANYQEKKEAQKS